MADPSPKASCGLCHKELTSRGMGRHLGSCLKKNIHRIADQTKDTPGIQHLKIHGGHRGSPYWLHLAVDQNTKLQRLDAFFRDIWLECCGHASAFFEQTPYLSPEINQSRALGKALGPHGSMSYIYDFGSETQLIIDSLGHYPGRIKGNTKLAILTRNPEPEIVCEACGREKAEYICQECLMEGEDAFLCPSCLEGHECDQEMLVRVMNSPRSGVCAYGSEDV